MKTALNVVAFQLAWWTAILSARAGLDVLAVAAVLALNAGFFLRAAGARPGFLAFACASTAFGLVVDSVLIGAGVFGAVGYRPVSWLCPFWLAAMWFNFAATFDFSMAWARTKPLAAVALGAVGGPLSYWAGERLGVVSFGDSPALPLAVLTVSWAGSMLALLRLREFCERLCVPRNSG